MRVLWLKKARAAMEAACETNSRTRAQRQPEVSKTFFERHLPNGCVPKKLT